MLFTILAMSLPVFFTENWRISPAPRSKTATLCCFLCVSIATYVLQLSMTGSFRLYAALLPQGDNPPLSVGPSHFIAYAHYRHMTISATRGPVVPYFLHTKRGCGAGGHVRQKAW